MPDKNTVELILAVIFLLMFGRTLLVLNDINNALQRLDDKKLDAISKTLQSLELQVEISLCGTLRSLTIDIGMVRHAINNVESRLDLMHHTFVTAADPLIAAVNRVADKESAKDSGPDEG
jgi:hypothetical protein